MPKFGALALLLLALASFPAVGAKRSEDLADWWNGPVRYIAEKKEVKLYRKLRSDEERALFIERFWARRDPTPETLTNEYREEFWERVAHANERFLDSARPGWHTDRGKIYILYGPPQDIENHFDLRPGGDLKVGHGVIRWIYRSRPEGRRDLDPIVVVPFQRQATGEYRVSTDPQLASIFFNPRAIATELPMERVLRDMFGSHGARSPLSVMLDLGKMQEVPPHAQVILERVETLEDYRTRRLATRLDRFRHPDRDGVLTVLTVDVTYVTEDQVPSIVARFQPENATRRTRVLGEDSFVVTEVGGRRFAQSRLVLDPGHYTLTALAVDPMSAIPSVARTEVELALPSGSLSVSPPLWAAELASLRFASLASHDDAFHVGPFRVVPRVSDRPFRPGETLRVFFETYGGTPPYRVRYRVHYAGDAGEIPLGETFEDESEGAARAWEFATSTRWPEGDYRLAIEVKDAGGNLHPASLPFRLETGDD